MATSSNNSTLKRRLFNKYRFRAATKWEKEEFDELRRGNLNIVGLTVDTMMDNDSNNEFINDLITSTINKNKQKDQSTAYIHKQKNDLAELCRVALPNSDITPTALSSPLESISDGNDEWISNVAYETVQSITSSLEE